MALQAYPNLLLRLDEMAAITECHLLPDTFPSQVRYGFRGRRRRRRQRRHHCPARLGRRGPPPSCHLQPGHRHLEVCLLPLDAPESQFGGWVGLSDIAPIGEGQFLVLERDNQGGPDAAIRSTSAISRSKMVPPSRRSWSGTSTRTFSPPRVESSRRSRALLSLRLAACGSTRTMTASTIRLESSSS